MHNTQIAAARIKLIAKQKGITIGKMLSSCELGINTISKMTKGTDILTQNILKIADYLECSVDYLLGRVDMPKSLYAKSPDNNHIETKHDKAAAEALEMYLLLDFDDQGEIRGDMYNSHNTATKIKNRAKEQNVIIKNMLSECKLGSNTLSAMYHGKAIAFDSLAKMADYLDCSVDYLLGRVDMPKSLYAKSPDNDHIETKHGKATAEALEMYLLLDSDDQGEIRGEMKHMLKAEKYIVKKESKEA